MENSFQQITAKAKKTSDWLKESVPESAQSYFDKFSSSVSDLPQTAQEYFTKVTTAVKNTSVVSDLATDIKENPKKVGAEAVVSGLAGAAVFAGLRLYDSYVSGKKEDEPDEKTVLSPESPESPNAAPMSENDNAESETDAEKEN